jgi:uncharacterized LabA/DUF88 family protein
MRTVPDTLTHERVAIFADFRNTLNTLRRAGRQIDLVALRDYLAEGRHLIEAFLYIGTHPLPEQDLADQATLHRLRQHGFLIRTKPAQLLPTGQLKCNFDLELALDVQEFVSRTRPDIVVLVTGDGDFTPLAQRLRLQGVRVEVASVPGSVSLALQAMANGFVDLTQIGNEVDNLPIPGLNRVEGPEPPAFEVAPLPEPDFDLEEPQPVLA